MLLQDSVAEALSRLNAATSFFDMGDTSVDWLLVMDNTDELKHLLDDAKEMVDELLRDLKYEPAWVDEVQPVPNNVSTEGA